MSILASLIVLQCRHLCRIASTNFQYCPLPQTVHLTSIPNDKQKKNNPANQSIDRNVYIRIKHEHESD